MELEKSIGRTRPFMGQLGSCPAIALPDSHNAGDFGTFLVGAPHPQAIKEEDLYVFSNSELERFVSNF